MKKSLLFFIFAVILFIPLSVKAANSYDITVNYTDTMRLTAPDEPIFSIQNLDPGDRLEKDITITNTSSNPVKMYIASVLPTDEASKFVLQKISFEIYYGNSLIQKGSYDQMTGVFLGLLNGNDTASYMMVLYFDKSAGNEYQGKTFNVDVTFLARDPDYVEPEKPIEPVLPENPTNTVPENEVQTNTVQNNTTTVTGNFISQSHGYDTAVAGETDVRDTSGIWGSLTARLSVGDEYCCNPWPWPPWCACWWHWGIISALLILVILQRRRIPNIRKMLDEAESKIEKMTEEKSELERKISDMTAKNVKKQTAKTKSNTNKKKKI